MAKKDLFTRYKNNPILTEDNFPDDWFKRHGWTPHAVFNAGVGDRDGKTLLNVRVEDRRGKSRLVCFCSKNGITDWEIDENTIFSGDPKEESYGVEDSRLTWIGSLNEWAIVYTRHSTCGPMINIATTVDFKKFNYLGNVLPPENKDAAIFPETINGYWWLIHRPVGDSKQIWIGKSKDTGSAYDDLSRWGGHQILLPTGTPWWDGHHIGLNAPPLKTKDGWLILYHGVRNTPNVDLYRWGLAMLSLDDPTVVTHRIREFIMGPKGRTDFIGDVGGAIFSCGWRVHDDGQLRVYYGSADLVICFAYAPLGKVINRVLQDPV
ncbi:MAG: glycosidase [Candidatus Falkowbacteria bacterium]